MNRGIIAAVVAAALVLGAAAPADAATGKRNWLSRDCNASHVVRDCVYEAVDADNQHRSFVFRDHRGHRHTVTHRADLTRIVKRHSHRCSTHGDQLGCYFVDQVEGMSIALPDGMSVAVTYLKK